MHQNGICQEKVIIDVLNRQFLLNQTQPNPFLMTMINCCEDKMTEISNVK